MNLPQRQLAAIKVNGIGDMVLNKLERHKFTFVKTKTQMYYLIGKRKVSVRDFELTYPLSLTTNMRPTLDSTKII